MRREDIRYFNSWAKSFRNCSPAKVMEGVINGIWIASNRDPEDIIKVYPKLITRPSCSTELDKQYGLCPFEFAFEDGESLEWHEKDPRMSSYKRRDINAFGHTWHLDKYELRKAITKDGLRYAKEFKITKKEIMALHKKHGWDDDAMYKELTENRPDLWNTYENGKSKYCLLGDLTFRDIRAALCPHFDTIYNWMDYPEKAGYPEIPNIRNRDYDWEAEE